MKALSLFVLGALLGSTALVPLGALAADGLVLLVFVTPEDRAVGQTVDINVEAYLWGAPVDLETLDVTIGFGAGNSVTMTNMSVGTWHGTYTITQGDASGGSFTVAASAALGLLTADEFEFYNVFDAGAGVTPGWDVSARIANIGQVGLSPAPGQSVIVEARSYFNGTLAEGGAINATVSYLSGITVQTDNLNGTKVQDGVYRFTFTVPSGITTSTSYDIVARLGTGTGAPADSVDFTANPIPVLVQIVAQTSTSASLNVWVGGAAPVAGAQVSLEGEGIIFTPPYLVTVGPFTATTDAAGKATIDATWNASSFLSFTLTVTSAGKTTTVLVALGLGFTGGWIPSPNFNFGCSVALQTDPSSLAPGQTATLKFRLTLDGAVVASRPVTRWVWLEGATASAQAGNVSTDAAGNFTITYTVPSALTDDTTLYVMALCPSGDTDTEFVPIRTAGSPSGSSRLSVTATPGTVGGTVQVTATYSGTSALNGAYAVAMLVPGENLSAVGAAGGSSSAFGELARTGTSFSGSITVPSWMPEGNYVVIVLVTNEGAAPTLAEETTEGNTTVVHVGPAAGGGPGGGSKGFLPGFGGLAALAGVAATAAVLVASRRRRID